MNLAGGMDNLLMEISWTCKFAASNQNVTTTLWCKYQSCDDWPWYAFWGCLVFPFFHLLAHSPVWNKFDKLLVAQPKVDLTSGTAILSIFQPLGVTFATVFGNFGELDMPFFALASS